MPVVVPERALVARCRTRLAAELRATRGLRLPDAVIVATGLRHEADYILTGDGRWKRIETVRVVHG